MKKKNAPLRRVYRDLRRQKPSALPLTVAYAALRGLQPFVYILFPAKLLDELLGAKNPQTLLTLALAAVLLQGALSLLLYALEHQYVDCVFWADMAEKNNISAHLLRIDFAKLTQSDFAAKVAQHRDESSREGGSFSQCLWVPEVVTTSVLCLVTVAVTLRRFWGVLFWRAGEGFVQSAWLGLAVFAGLAAAGLLLALVSGRVNKSNRGLRQEYADIDHIFSHYQNMVSNYKSGKEIRIFQQQAWMMQHATAQLLTRGRALQCKISGRHAMANGLSAVVFSLLGFGFYLLVGVKARAGLLTLGDMVICVGGLLQIVGAFRVLSNVFGEFHRIRPKAALYYEILDTPTRQSSGTLPPSVGTHTPSVEAHTLTCRKLGFRYDADSDFALQNVNLTLRPGEKIAVVGENGSGKTTFIHLLCGLLAAQEGEILLDGRDIRDYDEAQYRALFAVVAQDYRIFSLPLGENVAAGRDVDARKAKRLLRKADFPEKYSLDTPLYKDCDADGVELSGGEAQKLALARALYKDAAFLLLDEPTAALDPYAEFKLYTQFNELAGERSAIYISHRLSSCRFCDKIAVFDRGQIVQFGTHEALLREKDGKYHALWCAQAKYFQKEEC